MARRVLGSVATSRLRGDDAAQQAVRWNLFQLAQASACTHEQGIAAKGVTGAGYEGHYFWDTEIYVVPFLAYTNPRRRDSLLRFRWHMLPKARQRAIELNQRGALYPWRTINGEEASAYYAAGTAQYHINAAVASRAEALPRRQRRRRLPRRRGRRDPRRDGAPLGGPRLLRDERRARASTSTASPAPTSTRPSSTTTCTRTSWPASTCATRRGSSNCSPRANTDAYESLLRRLELDPAEVERWIEAAELDVPALRRGAGHPPAGRRVPGTRGMGLRRTRRPRTTRCCCTTTRW